MDNLPSTCFVVDDDASMRRSLSFLIRSFGYRVETFESAEAFLARKAYDGVGCIITDVKMPGMSGLDLQDTLGHGTNSLPIIFISGHGDLPMGVAAMKKGAIDFLPKPFDDDNLARLQNKNPYRSPDSFPAPSRRLSTIVPAYQKVGGSRAIGPHLDPNNNRSRSFANFVKGIRRLCEDCA